MQIRTCLTSFAALAAGLGLASCSDGTGPSNQRGLTLSFVVQSTTAPAAAVAAATDGHLVTGSANGTLTIDQVQLVLGKIEFALSTADDCDDDHDSANCEEVEAGPMLVDLPVGGDLVSPILANAPAGTYEELEVKLQLPRNGEKRAAFLALNPTWPDGGSVHVKGSFDAGNGAGPQPFDVYLSAEARFELEFDPPLVVDPAAVAQNVTVAVDVLAWFRTAAGDAIDPRLLSADSALREAVLRSIRRSLRAFGDDDHDGRGDRHGDR